MALGDYPVRDGAGTIIENQPPFEDMRLSKYDIHPRTHFFCSALRTLKDSDRMWDQGPLGNHVLRGANLSIAQLWANYPYMSTVDPAGGSPDSVLRAPNLNLDYAAGESMLFVWDGKLTPDGSGDRCFGDGFGTTRPGISLRASAAGKFDLVISDAAGQDFTGASTGTPFDGTRHQIAVFVNGQTKSYMFWTDGVPDPAVGSGLNYMTLAAGRAVDTRNSRTWNFGHPSPAADASILGQAMQIGVTQLIRFAKSDTLPTVAKVTAVLNQMRANPMSPILRGAFE